jgi:hypothetical protein
MVYLDSAYYGDEKSSRNVTSTLLDRILSGKPDIVADETLYPAVETVDEIKLTAEDQKNIRSEAQKKCNPADQKCMEVEMGRLRQERMKEKEKEAITSTPVYKGSRLTMNVIGDDGVRRTIVVPAGQKYKLDKIRSRADYAITFEKVVDVLWNAINFGFLAFIFVLVITIPFKLLKDDGNMPFAWGSTGANLINPYLGTSAAFGKYFWQGWTSDKNTPKQ